MIRTCKEHPRYRGMGAPTGGCRVCWKFFRQMPGYRRGLVRRADEVRKRHRQWADAESALRAYIARSPQTAAGRSHNTDFQRLSHLQRLAWDRKMEAERQLALWARRG